MSRDRRPQPAERDAAILAAAEVDQDLDELAEAVQAAFDLG